MTDRGAGTDPQHIGPGADRLAAPGRLGALGQRPGATLGPDAAPVRQDTASVPVGRGLGTAVRPSRGRGRVGTTAPHHPGQHRRDSRSPDRSSTVRRDGPSATVTQLRDPALRPGRGPVPHLPGSAAVRLVPRVVDAPAESAARRERPSAAWLVLAAFVAVQIHVVVPRLRGASLDEAIYLTAGRRTLAGHGIDDGYMTWFAGSLGWPVLSALAAGVGGLSGSRTLAVALVTIGIAGSASAAGRLFGRAAQLWTAVVLCGWGAVLAVAHLAVYDSVAIAGLGVTLACTARYLTSGHRGWLLGVALALVVATVGKYPAVAMALPVAALLVLGRRRRVVGDLIVLGLVAGAALLAYFLPYRFQLGDFLLWRTDHNPDFGVAQATVLAEQLYLGAALLVAAALGAVVCRPARRHAPALLLAMAMFPAYHVLTANSVGASKHVVFGGLFAAPLAGALLAQVWRSHWLARLPLLGVAVAWGAVGLAQMERADVSWPDLDPVAAFLAERVVPGDELLVSNSWPITERLEREGRLDSVWDVYDAYRVADGQARSDLCSYDWFVDEEQGNGWDPALRAELEACGTFREVFVDVSSVTNRGIDGFVTYPVRTVVLRNESPTTGGPALVPGEPR